MNRELPSETAFCGEVTISTQKTYNLTIINNRRDLADRYFDIHFLPWMPDRAPAVRFGAVVGIFHRAVVIVGRIAGRDPEQVEDIGFSPDIVIGAGDLEIGDFFETLNIGAIGIEDGLIVDLLLEQSDSSVSNKGVLLSRRSGRI